MISNLPESSLEYPAGVCCTDLAGPAVFTRLGETEPGGNYDTRGTRYCHGFARRYHPRTRNSFPGVSDIHSTFSLEKFSLLLGGARRILHVFLCTEDSRVEIKICLWSAQQGQERCINFFFPNLSLVTEL
jgi:hypothetical protein